MHRFFIALGAVLDRSWVDLRFRLGSKKWFSHWFYNDFLKIDVFEKRSLQDAFLTQLDPIWAPKRVPRGAQDELKTDPKRVQNRAQNRSEKMIEKWTAQGSMRGIDGGHALPRGPPGGGWGGINQSTKDPYLRSSTPLGHRPGEFLIRFLNTPYSMNSLFSEFFRNFG